MSTDVKANREPATIAVDLRSLVGAPSGIGYFTISMLNALEKTGSARYIGMAHRQVDDEARSSLTIDLESHGGPFGVWWQQVRLPKRLAVGDVDLLWSPLTVLPNKVPIPSVVTIHDLTVLSHPQTHRLKVRWSILPFLERTVRQASAIAVDSKATADDLLSRFPQCSDRLQVVYPGVEPRFKPGTAEEIERTRAKLGCRDGYILYSGTLEPRKNVDRLISAWQNLDRSTKRPSLVLAGPYGWRSADLMRRIESLADQGLIYQGRLAREDLVRLMQAASVFVYPSYYEGFGLPPAEAMACGVPTVVSDRSSLPEIVGGAGILVDPLDVGAIQRAIEQIVGDEELASDLATKGRERSKRFDWTTSAELMNRIFVEALR